MAEDNGILTNLLKTELSSINKGIIKRRKSLKDLLNSPVIGDGDAVMDLDKSMLEEVSRKLKSPSSEVFFPVTIYLPSGASEGYITGEREARTAHELGAGGITREGKYWVQKYRARSFSRKYPGLFQIFYTV